MSDTTLSYKFRCSRCSKDSSLFVGGHRTRLGLVCTACHKPKKEMPPPTSPPETTVPTPLPTPEQIQVAPGSLPPVESPGQKKKRELAELAAKIRGDIEIRGMSLKEAALVSGVDLEKARRIANYLVAIHVLPK